MAYLVEACIVMACIAMAYIVMVYIVMAYIGMAYLVMANVVMAYIGEWLPGGARRRPAPRPGRRGGAPSGRTPLPPLGGF